MCGRRSTCPLAPTAGGQTMRRWRRHRHFFTNFTTLATTPFPFAEDWTASSSKGTQLSGQCVACVCCAGGSINHHNLCGTLAKSPKPKRTLFGKCSFRHNLPDRRATCCLFHVSLTCAHCVHLSWSSCIKEYPPCVGPLAMLGPPLLCNVSNMASNCLGFVMCILGRCLH